MSEEEQGQGNPKKMKLTHETPDQPHAAAAPDNRSLTEGQRAFLDYCELTPYSTSPPQPQGPGAPPPDLDEIVAQMDNEDELKFLARLSKEERENSRTFYLFVFLFVREVPQSLKDEAKTKFFKEILNESSGPRKRLEAILQIIEGAARTFVRTPSRWEPKYPFQGNSLLSNWNKEHNTDNDFHEFFYLVFDALSCVPHQEVQRSRNCYLAAAIAFMTYAVQKGRLADSKSGDSQGVTTPRTIRMDQFIRRSFGPYELYERVMNNKGGSAIDVFKSLSARDDFRDLELQPHMLDFERLVERLQEFGAGLVTGFHVDHDFLAQNKLSYKGKVAAFTPDTKKGHAMVLVGIRKERVSGVVWLLLQNWWKSKQFVEVTLEYLISSTASVHFALQKHTEFNNKFTMTQENFIETCFDDGGDEEVDVDDGK